MSHPLISKLRELVQMSISITTIPKASDNLSDVTTPLSDELSDKVEDIERTSVEQFGPNKRPSKRDLEVMANLGFKVTPVETDIVGWKKAQIETPIGRIEY